MTSRIALAALAPAGAVLVVMAASTWILSRGMFERLMIAHGASTAEAGAMFEQTVGVVALGALGMGALIAAAVAVVLARHLAGPLRSMQATAQRLEGGDLSARVGAAPDVPELATLAEALDSMAEALERQEQVRRDFVTVGVEEIEVDAVAALVAAVEVKDRETQGHNRRVAELAVKIGHQLGMTAAELRVLARSGLLHDVGKLGIPDAILHKSGSLEADEWTAMKRHPEIGTQILHRTGTFKRELLAVLYHHERMDGSGYPHGLAGDAIPIEARVLAVADTFDVLTSDRPYRRACDRKSALIVLRQEAGAHLDARVVDALFSAVALRVPTSPVIAELRPGPHPALQRAAADDRAHQWSSAGTPSERSGLLSGLLP